MDDLEKIINIDFTPNADEIYTHLVYTTNLLNKYNIKYWICYGTLLGAIRNKDIIEYDYDFDLGILYEDYEKVLSLNSEALENNYKFVKGKNVLYKFEGKKNESIYDFKVSLKINYFDNPVGDMYIYKECPDGLMRRYDPDDKILFWPNSTFPKVFINELINIKIRDKNFFSPMHAEILVDHWYGELWKIPIKANSQNGEGHVDYDYYGSYKYISLNNLICKTKEIFNIEIKQNFSINEIKYYFPLDQYQWIIENEKVK